MPDTETRAGELADDDERKPLTATRTSWLLSEPLSGSGEDPGQEQAACPEAPAAPAPSGESRIDHRPALRLATVDAIRGSCGSARHNREAGHPAK